MFDVIMIIACSSLLFFCNSLSWEIWIYSKNLPNAKRYWIFDAGDAIPSVTSQTGSRRERVSVAAARHSVNLLTP